MAQSNTVITCHNNKGLTEDEISDFFNNLFPRNENIFTVATIHNPEQMADNKAIIGKRKQYVKGKFTENFINKQGDTVLWYSVYHHNHKIVQYLLKNKENYELKKADSYLGMYIKFNDGLVMDILSSENRWITISFSNYYKYLRDELDRTYVVLCGGLNFCSNVQAVILDNKDYYGEYAFFDALRKKNYYIYKENTPLNQALYDNNTELAELLLEAGADPNIKIANDTVNGLVYALFYGNHKLVAMLMRNGAEIYDNYLRIASRMQTLNSPKYSGSMLPVFCDCKNHDFNKSKEIFEYFIFIKRKTRIVALSREFDENSLFHPDYLCEDLFKLIMRNNVMMPNDEFLAIREEKGWGSWLKSLIGYFE